MNDNTPATDPWSTATDAATPDTATPATPDPWGSAGAQADAANPYDAPPPPDGSDAWLGGDAAPSGDFLAASPDAPVAVAPDGGFSISQLWDGSLPVQDWINHGLDWVVLHFRPFFHALRGPVDALLGGVEAALQWPPTLVMIAVLALLAWQLAGGVLGAATLVSLLVVAALGIWPEAMVTLSLVLTSLLFCVVIGLPLGIWLARSERAQKWVRPLLDAMQTTPAFVYLVPVVMLFGLGDFPAMVAIVLFALPPAIRYPMDGIARVPKSLVEAADMAGCTRLQRLVLVQIPQALPEIMLGLSQTILMAFGMLVITAPST